MDSESGGRALTAARDLIELLRLAQSAADRLEHEVHGPAYEHYEFLARVFERLWERGETVRLLIAGKETPDCMELTRRLRLHPQQGKLLMTLGTPGKSGDGPNEFNAPSAVLVAPNGNIFVADGHGGNTNARIVKFSRDGKFIKTWGKKGSAPGEMDGPHTLAMDSQGRLFLGDRGNNRIQIFDQDGNFIDQWTQFSRPSGIFIDKADNIYVADSESESVSKNHDGCKRGIRIGRVHDAVVTAFIPDPAEKATGTSAAAPNKASKPVIRKAVRKASPTARTMVPSTLSTRSW